MSTRERGKKGGGTGDGKRVFKRFRSHIIIKIHSSCEIEYFLKTRLYKLCVILRSRVLIIYVGACFTRGAGSRQSCGVWRGRGRWREGREMIENYVMDG